MYCSATQNYLADGRHELLHSRSSLRTVDLLCEQPTRSDEVVACRDTNDARKAAGATQRHDTSVEKACAPEEETLVRHMYKDVSCFEDIP